MSGDMLDAILARKRREIERRRRRRAVWSSPDRDGDRGPAAVRALRRSGGPLRVIAEVKRRSPSRGELRAHRPGDAVEIAQLYEAAGAAAVSVLADRAGFDGSPLDVRRVAHAVTVPVLFKEFVLDECQVELARAMGASLVLLVVRTLARERLGPLVEAIRARGMAPVVEAASPEELQRAVDTGADIVGINSRDLSTFVVDPVRALEALEETPRDRVAVYMSGVRGAGDLQRVASGRADALLVGEALMRAPDPGEKLTALLDALRPADQ